MDSTGARHDKKKDPLTSDEFTDMINTLIVQGTKNIVKATYRSVFYPSVEKNGKLVQKKEFVIDTEGTDLEYLLGIYGLDFTKTFSNDVNEIHDLFGIESARRCLYEELTMVLTADGGYLNSRHLGLLADNMTNFGFICSVSRHGMKKSESGPLLRASFEETADVFFSAAAEGLIDNVKGITGNIMFGKRIQSGTGSFSVVAKKKPEALFVGKRREKKQEQHEERQRFWKPFENVLQVMEQANYQQSMQPEIEPQMQSQMFQSPMFEQLPIFQQSQMQSPMFQQYPIKPPMLFAHPNYEQPPPSPTYSPDHPPPSPTYSPDHPPPSPTYSPDHPPPSPTYSPEHPPSPPSPLKTENWAFDEEQTYQTNTFTPLKPPKLPLQIFQPLQPPKLEL